MNEKWTNNRIYEVIIDGINRELGPDISEINILRYKLQDNQRIARQGGTLATDEEYQLAEKRMQEIYKLVMGV